MPRERGPISRVRNIDGVGKNVFPSSVSTAKATSVTAETLEIVAAVTGVSHKILAMTLDVETLKATVTGQFASASTTVSPFMSMPSLFHRDWQPAGLTGVPWFQTASGEAFNLITGAGGGVRAGRRITVYAVYTSVTA